MVADLMKVWCRGHERGPKVADLMMVVVVWKVVQKVVQKVVRKVVRNPFFEGFCMVLWYFSVPYFSCTRVLRRFLRFVVCARWFLWLR